MEHKTEGAVLVRFKINKKGEPTEMEVDGDPVLTPSVRLEFKWLRVSRECSGKQVSVRLTYRIDPSLPLSDAVLTRKLSDAEYEIVSPAKNVVVLADPPVTGARTRVPRAFRWLGKLKFW